jgi:hypothetical protein
MKLELKKIRTDGGTQPRAKLSGETIDDYARDMRNGDVFLPIAVFFDGNDYWLADGFHRVAAARQVDPKGTIKAEVFQGTQFDAQWHSYGVNKTHGLRRTNEDKARAIRAALVHPRSRDLSDAAVAEHVGVRRETVLKYRHEAPNNEPQCDQHSPSESELDLLETNKSTHRVGRDGRRINTAKIGKRASQKTKQRRRGVQISRNAHMPKRRHSSPNPMIPLQFSPNNAQTAAATLVREFAREWVEMLILELTRYLSDQGEPS